MRYYFLSTLVKSVQNQRDFNDENNAIIGSIHLFGSACNTLNYSDEAMAYNIKYFNNE